MLLILALVAEKVADIIPAATVTDAGTESAEVLVLLKATETPPAGAVVLSAAVQVLVPLGPQLLGLHDTEDMVTVGPARPMVTLLEVLL